jgi:urease gamma subunit
MKFKAFLLALSPCAVFAASADITAVYEISELRGAQIYYASHIKPEAMSDPKKIDDEDRAALMGAIGKTGIAMPRLKVPHVDESTRVQESVLKLVTITEDDGSKTELAQNEYKGGKDNMMMFKKEDTITCLLMSDGVMQIYTIHLNVTFPDGEKLVTMQTTRNRPLGVSTMNVSGKAKRIK